MSALVLPVEQRRPATTVALSVLSLQQTQDHGYFSFAVRQGRLTQEESLHIEQAESGQDLSPTEQAHFAQRNKITCAVRWTDFPRIPTCSLPLLPGDGLVLCTDGVHDNLTDQEIVEVLQANKETSAQRLVSAASHRSQQEHFRAKHDDISAIVAWLSRDRNK